MRADSDPFIDTAKVRTRPISSEAHEGPGSEPSSADDDDHEQDRAKQSGHVRLRHQRRSGDHAGDRGKRGADTEHQHEDTSDVVTEMADHVRMGQRAWTIRPIRVFFRTINSPTKITDRHQQHEHLVGGIVGGEDREGREIQQRRYAEIDRALAPDDLHDFLDHEGEAEGEQQFGDMTVLVDAAQAVSLDAGADRAGQQRVRSISAGQNRAIG